MLMLWIKSYAGRRIAHSGSQLQAVVRVGNGRE